MVLSSQSPRPTAGRQYMVSRRKRRFRHPLRWLALAAVVVLAGFILFGGGGGDAVGPEGDSASTPVADSKPATASPLTPDVAAPAPSPSPGVTRATPPVAPPIERVRPEPPPPAILTYNTPPASSPGGREPAVTEPGEEADPVARSAASPTSPLVIAPPPTAAPPLTTPAANPAPSAGDALAPGLELVRQGKVVEGRAALNRLLAAGRLSAEQEARVRGEIAAVNDSLVFGDRIVPGDPLVEVYTIQSGDNLIRVGRQFKITSDLIARINHMADKNRISAGQKVKVVKGPFHAVVDKSDFRLDLYLDAPGGGRMYVRSFPVGVGESYSTPEGLWRVRGGGVGKLVNPSWKNPRNEQFFDRDDPKNPIGEFWIGLEGIDDQTRGLPGYGIHGTIEPESIGRQASMGCVRLGSPDIEALYHILVEEFSTVLIRP